MNEVPPRMPFYDLDDWYRCTFPVRDFFGGTAVSNLSRARAMRNAYWRHADTLFDHYHFFHCELVPSRTLLNDTSQRCAVISPPRDDSFRLIVDGVIKRYCFRLTFAREASHSRNVLTHIVFVTFVRDHLVVLHRKISFRPNSRRFLSFQNSFRRNIRLRRTAFLDPKNLIAKPHSILLKA